GQEFPRLTPLMRDATDTHLLVKWDGTQGKAIALSARPASSPSSNELSAIYVGACFRINHVNWPASADSDEKRRAAFIGTSVSVDDE
ncbi:head decoration protein, partial [Vibrio anguillarum]